jgi:hypothetical protein
MNINEPEERMREIMTRNNQNTPTVSYSVSSPSFTDSEPPNYYEATQYYPTCSSECVLTNVQRPIIFTINRPNRQSQFSSNKHSNQIQNSHSTLNQSSIAIHREPNDYLLWSIITSIYCIFIGLTAIIFSLKIKELNANGRYDLSYKQSKIVRNLNLSAILFGFLYISIALLFYFYPPGL